MRMHTCVCTCVGCMFEPRPHAVGVLDEPAVLVVADAAVEVRVVREGDDDLCMPYT